MKLSHLDENFKLNKLYCALKRNFSYSCSYCGPKLMFNVAPWKLQWANTGCPC